MSFFSVWDIDNKHHCMEFEKAVDKIMQLQGPIYDVERKNAFTEMKKHISGLKDLQGPIYKIDRKHGYDEYNPPVEHGLYSIILVVEDCEYDKSPLIAFRFSFLEYQYFEHFAFLARHCLYGLSIFFIILFTLFSRSSIGWTFP